MKSIVVPVNFTVNSNNAAHYAADLALAIGADIHLIHSFQVPLSVSEVPMPETVFEEMQETGLQQLSTLSADLRKRTNGKIGVTTEMKIGTVEGSIQQFCIEQEPLVVVMGATGKGLENMLTGSNTINAVRHLPYPVLVVPENARYQPIRKIAVACDYEDLVAGLPVATPVIQELSELPGVSLEVVHVITGDESASEFTLGFNHWKNGLKGISPELIIIREANVEKALTGYLQDCPADLLLVFPKKHGLLEFHRSQTKKLVLHCAVPVVSVHE